MKNLSSSVPVRTPKDNFRTLVEYGSEKEQHQFLATISPRDLLRMYSVARSPSVMRR